MLPSEVFPQSVRSKGVALSTASNWYVYFVHLCACTWNRLVGTSNVLGVPDRGRCVRLNNCEHAEIVREVLIELTRVIVFLSSQF